jgi:hypothetical protein
MRIRNPAFLFLVLSSICEAGIDVLPREMENISRGSTFGDLSLSTERGRCRTSQLQDYRVQEYRLRSFLSFTCNVLLESLFVESQNIPGVTLKRRGPWKISIYLWLFLYYTPTGEGCSGDGANTFLPRGF